MEKIVLVTGASRGIGAATAKLLASEGYTLCLNYLKSTKAVEQVLRDIREAGGKAFVVQADVSEEEAVNRLFAQIDQYPGQLTGLVNNAGILFRAEKVVDMEVERWMKVYKSNVISAFLCSREAIKRMQSGASIVNVSSIAAKLGSAFEYVDYAASKGAMDTFTIGLAQELAAQNIRVNGVRPGLIYTDIHADSGNPNRVDDLKKHVPMQRGGRADEVAACISWLISDKSSYVTGTNLDVGGGR